ncbi:MAG: hypothetical protein ACE5J4_02530 [Candidatus Aenigmatarchaeota archaeon]
MIYRCPKCKSKNIKYIPWLGQMWRCPQCNYQGPLVVEEDKNANRKVQTKKT